MLRRRRGLFAAAEMLDGGMATGAAAGKGVLDWLREKKPA
jgi:hypothetical protein